MNCIILIMNGIDLLIDCIDLFIDIINKLIQGIKAVTPSPEAWARQLVAGRPQADRPNHSSVPIGPLIDR